jgi:ubiquinone/menaquinone biosynthesis C-methylase UbiE
MNYSDLVVTALSYLKQVKKRKLIKIAFQFRSKSGVEIGGPSVFFKLKNSLPIYVFAKKVDGVNFSNETVWEGAIKEGETYNYYKKEIGHQYIAEATELPMIPDDKYDFLLSCHSLEHVANPIKALKEWSRIIKKDGMFVLVLPDKRYTFDRNRSYTSFEHLLEDYRKDINEYDTTHFEDIIQHHDREKDPGLKPNEEVRELLNKNYENRLAHHHVFSQSVVKQLVEYCGFSVLSQHEAAPFHLITIAKKV